MSKILICGGAGFIGSHLVRYCVEQGNEVTVFDNLSGGRYANLNNQTFFHHKDVVKDVDFLNKLFAAQKFDVCFCLSSYASEGRSNHIRSFIHSNNTVGTANVINACVNYKCKLVFTSSVAVYSGVPPFDENTDPNPIDEYGLSKYMSERSIVIAADTQGLEYCIIRPRNVYGQGQNIFDRSRNLFGIWMYNALNNLPCQIFNGTNIRTFTYIDDIIPSLYKAKDISCEMINLGSVIEMNSIDRAADIFQKVTGYYNFEYTSPRHEVKEAFCSAIKSKELLGFEDKTSLEDGLTKMWAWAQTVPMRDLDKMPELEVTINAHSSLK